MGKYKKPLFPLGKTNKYQPDMAIFRKIGIIGDSLSSGEHESYIEGVGKGFHDYYEYSWGQYIARAIGCECEIFARGGMYCHGFLNDYIKENNLFEPGRECQAYFIALGVNDFGSRFDVIYHSSPEMIYEYYEKIIKSIREFSPKSRIFIITIPDEGQKEKRFHDDFRKFQLGLEKKYEFLYVIDLRKHAPKYKKRFHHKYFLGTHMSALGYKHTADMIMAYVDNIINKNPKDFAQIAFLGKGVHNDKEKW